MKYVVALLLLTVCCGLSVGQDCSTGQCYKTKATPVRTVVNNVQPVRKVVKTTPVLFKRIAERRQFRTAFIR